MAKEYKVKHSGRKRQKIEASANPVREGSHEEILAFESLDLLMNSPNSQTQIEDSVATKDPSGKFSSVEVEVEQLSSTGDGLALSEDRERVYVVPYSVPGDRVLVKVYPVSMNRNFHHVNFVNVVRPSPLCEGVTPGCKYFSKCSGCQLQMLPYDQQLEHKRRIVEKAFQYFSGLSPEHVPTVRPTMGSPLEYGYRTKLTPHFDGPWNKQDRRKAVFTEVPAIGFTLKNMKRVMDIEDCPIATDIVREGLKAERNKVAEKFQTYKNGATILIRETTDRTYENDQEVSTSGSPAPPATANSIELAEPLSTAVTTTSTGSPAIKMTYPNYTDIKSYISNNDGYCTEYIGDFKFTSRAGSFFQNNNSILAPFIAYVRDNCLPASPAVSILPSSSSPKQSSSPPRSPQKSQSQSPSRSEPTAQPTPGPSPIKYLLDAYCGSGLFTVTLSSLFASALGIDIDRHSITAARLNAKNNSIVNAGFLEADAGDLFADVPFPRDQSLVVIDPPRKGASEDFLKQLCEFGPRRVVYVSCNVHTQARDVGMLVRGFPGEGFKYKIESLRGFDFFPQTGHVEGVAVLDRVSKEDS